MSRVAFTKKVTSERPKEMGKQVIKVAGERIFWEEGRTSTKSLRWELAWYIQGAARRLV